MALTLAQQIRQFVINPALKIADLWSEAAEILVYGTGIVESNYEYLIQIGEPADSGLGFWQMESSDYSDLSAWLKFQKAKPLLNNILAASYYDHLPSDPQALVSNLKFAALMCRIHYYRVPYPLPSASDAAGLASWHKSYYNTALGDADVAKNTEVFQRIIDGEI